jgi:hypothetical protein
VKISNSTWKLADFLRRWDRIEAQPTYQRGPVWNESKQRLLIDSIIRGFDIPKIYLHRLSNNPMFDYQIVDGQQRLTAIWKFHSNNLTLVLPDDLADATWADCDFSALNTRDRTAFERFRVVTAIVEEADDDDIRDLFSRLQMGEHLTPAEIRNSLRSAIGNEIRNIAENHRFFRNSSFASTRFKHHDLAAHAFALQLNQATQDVKAPNLRAMYVEHADSVRPALATRVAAVLDALDDVQRDIPGWINRKWGFVDLYLCLAHIPQPKRPAADVLASRYKAFETERRRHVGRPEALLRGTPRKRDLYRYIKAFQMGGGIAENLQIRHEVLCPILLGRT